MYRPAWLIPLLVAGVCSCAKTAEPPRSVDYESYEDCVLDKLGRGQSKIASEAIISACKRKYSRNSDDVAEPPHVARRPVADKRVREACAAAGPNACLYDDLPRARFDEYDPPGSPRSWEEIGYPCKDDCTGHWAGWDWAETNGVTDPATCGGNSESFIEGCIAYTEAVDQG